jgi:hypothetical protein
MRFPGRSTSSPCPKCLHLKKSVRTVRKSINSLQLTLGQLRFLLETAVVAVPCRLYHRQHLYSLFDFALGGAFFGCNGIRNELRLDVARRTAVAPLEDRLPRVCFPLVPASAAG